MDQLLRSQEAAAAKFGGTLSDQLLSEQANIAVQADALRRQVAVGKSHPVAGVGL